jgi:hypothetical protein
MKDLILTMPWLASFCSAVCLAKALRFFDVRHSATENHRARLVVLLAAMVMVPSLAHAAAADLKTAVEAGNAIIMYLCGVLAAVGIISAGVAMMMGRQQIAKWAFAGSMISGLGFAIVKTMWSNFGLTAADVSTFTP